MIVLEKLSKFFWRDEERISLLEEVSFSFPLSGIVGILGENGIGKSTLLKIILGLSPISHGILSYDSSLGKSPKEIFSHFSYLPEQLRVFKDIKALDFLHFIGLLKKNDKKKIKEEIQELTAFFSLDQSLHLPVHKFSKGMQAKLGIIQSLLGSPKIIILDEPFSGIDPYSRPHIIAKIKEHVLKTKALLILTGHVIEDLRYFVDELLVIKNKKLLRIKDKNTIFYPGEIQKRKVVYQENGLYQEIFIEEKNIALWLNEKSKKEDFQLLTIGYDEEEMNHYWKNFYGK